MQRLINRRQQGDLGEASAIEWLTRQGATVSMPLGHSPDYDLIAEIDGRLVRVQVKTSTRRESTPDGHERWSVAICTNGGNQSLTGLTKRFDATKADALFVLVGDGRRWFIPAAAVEGARSMRLGGRKYSEFEIDPSVAILPLVYATWSADSRIRDTSLGERRSGRAGLGCKPSATLLRGFESLLPHRSSSQAGPPSRERPLGRAGQAIVRGKRQMTMPFRPFTEAGLEIGDRLRFRADGPGRVVIDRIGEGTDNPRLSSDPPPPAG
jgi:PD-(D/E)XK endonuclease